MNRLNLELKTYDLKPLPEKGSFLFYEPSNNNTPRPHHSVGSQTSFLTHELEAANVSPFFGRCAFVNGARHLPPIMADALWSPLDSSYEEISVPKTTRDYSPGLGFFKACSEGNKPSGSLLDVIFSEESKVIHANTSYSNREFLNPPNKNNRPPPPQSKGYHTYDSCIDKNDLFLRFDSVRVKQKIKHLNENNSIIFRFVMFYSSINNNEILSLFSLGDGTDGMSHGQLAFGSEDRVGSCLAAGVISFTKTQEGVSISSLSNQTGHFKCPLSSLLLAIRMLNVNFKEHCFGNVQIYAPHCSPGYPLVETNWNELQSRLLRMNINDTIDFLQDRVNFAKKNLTDKLHHFKLGMDCKISDAKEFAKNLGYQNKKIGAFKWNNKTVVLWIDDIEKQFSELDQQIFSSSLYNESILIFMPYYDTFKQALNEFTCATSMEKKFIESLTASQEEPKARASSPWLGFEAFPTMSFY